MADEEHLSILKQGVESWNRWREEHPEIIPDLRGVNFDEANLAGAAFEEARLEGASFQKAFLDNVDFKMAILTEAKLYRASLTKADLSGATLKNADLSFAYLYKADLSGCDLTEANLDAVDLSWVSLVRANLRKANITGATLYGTARDDWRIDGIHCEFVFWDLEGLVKTPRGRQFASGEFEEWYESLPVIEYFFEYGFTPIDAMIMDRVVLAINERHPEFELKLDSFHSRGQQHAVFTVLHKEHAEQALQEITQEYETKIKVLEGQRDELRTALSKAIDRPQAVKNIIMMNSQAGVIGDNTYVDGGIHFDSSTQETRNTEAGRDYFEQVRGNVSTETVIHGDQVQHQLIVQQFAEGITPQSSKEDIQTLLKLVLEELKQINMPEDIKAEVENDVKGAEIQLEKAEPDKMKVADRLKNATEPLKATGSLGEQAIAVGKMLAKAIEWLPYFL